MLKAGRAKNKMHIIPHKSKWHLSIMHIEYMEMVGHICIIIYKKQKNVYECIGRNIS